MEVEHFLLSKIALQVLSDADRAYSRRCTRKQQITAFQGHEAADISNDFIYPEQHVRCMTALHLLIINRQMEVQILHVSTRLLQRDELVETAKRNNTTLLDELKHADYGIENIGYLFPDAKSITDEPITLDRDQSWVSVVMNGTKHSPFARIKSVLADIRDDAARARGYAKKAQKKTEEVIKLLTRTTSPTTIYKKQKLDRDDIVDITDFNVVSWLKNEMKGKLNEEIARAILIGDGRTITDPDRIDDEAIRPILKENDLYAIHKSLDSNTTDETLVDDIVLASAELEGSGAPTLFIAKKRLVKMLLLKDKNCRRLYETEASLAGALGVSKIVTVPQFEGLQHEIKGVNHELLAIVVDLRDYTIGSNAGAELGMAESFDIDFNQYKYLMETRLSGSLTAPYSALSVSRKKA